MFGLGSNTQLGIGIALSLHDRFSGKANQINQTLTNLRANANNQMLGAMRDYRNQAAVIAVAAGTAARGIWSMAEASAEFQHRINQVAIVGEGKLGKTAGQLSDFANELSRTFSQSNLDVSNTLYENVKAGVRGNLEEVTSYQLAAANATGENATMVAETLLGISQSFDLPIEAFKRVANATTAAANSSPANIEDIGYAMQYSAFTAKNFNVSLEQQLALVAKLSQAHIKGSSAGTGLNNMFLQLAKSLGPFQTKKQLKGWALLGLDPESMKEMANSGNIFGVIQSIQEAAKGMNAVDRNATIQGIFNTRGDRAIEGLFDSKNGNKSIMDFYKETQSGVGGDIAMTQSKLAMNDFWGDMAKFGNSLKEFKDAFTTSVLPIIRPFVWVITKMMHGFTAIIKTPVGAVLGGLALAASGTVAILFAFRAATMAAVIALRTLSMSRAVGGYSGLMAGGLGMVGTSRFGTAAGNFGYNAAGRLYATNSFSYGGQNYGKGRILPGSFAQGLNIPIMGTPGAFGSGAGATSILGRIAGFGLRWLPVIGLISMGISLVGGIFGMMKKKDKDEKVIDPIFDRYYKEVDAQLNGYTNSNDYYRDKFGMTKEAKDQRSKLNQQIIVNVDGRKVVEKTVAMNFEDDFNRRLAINSMG